ncbi:PAS domain S-box protein [Hydrogenophaga sp.]|uniref:PAS domain S-box protein n=1 Tax=Hydrogenophaga sp. TaxID=1904254 RepID=UPI00286DB610|nr:PAS domain S-box protein [Hydrogenophaga sp.]
MRWHARCLTTLLLFAAQVTCAVQAAPRVVRVGVYENPPKLLVGSQGQPSGILGDLLSEMARREGWTLDPMPCDWERCLRLLEEGHIDLMPDVAYSDARAQRFDFHQVPALSSWSQVYRRPGATLQSVLDLDGKRVAVLDGSVQQEHLAGLLNSFGLRAELVPVKSFDEAFRMVAAGAADAVAANRYSGDAAAGRYGLTATSLVFLPSKLYFAVDKGRNADLLAAIDARLDAWQNDADSFYFQTLARWGLQAATPRVPLAFWWGLAALVGLLLLALGFLALLRREVARQTLALGDSEQRFRNLAENSVDWIWEQDLHGRHTYSNPGITAILGLRVHEFLALDAATLVHPDDLALFGATNRESRARGTGWRNVLIRWRHRDGGYRVLESNGVPVFDAQGALHGFQGVDRDITHRVLAEQERQRLASILEATGDGVGMADPDGRVIYLNTAGRAMLGIGPEDPLPAMIADVHPQWAVDIILGQGLQTASREGRWAGETAVRGPDGQDIPVAQLILSHKDAQGQPLYFSTILHDIRESRAAERALRESEERLRLALSAASQGLYDLDLSTGVAQVSPEYATMLGYDAATFQETSAAWRERMHPEDRTSVYQAFEACVAGDLPEYRVEFRQRTRDGGWKWILSLGKVQGRTPDGRALRLLGTHTDIDAIKVAEAALRELNATLEARVAERTAELTLANQELETFAYAVSHDLRAPLRAITGYSGVLLEDHAAALPQEARLFIKQIVLASRKMSDLVEGLLTLSRSTRGELRWDRVDVSAQAQRHLAELAAADPTRRVAVEVEQGLVVRGDERLIASVVDNLLDNAWKYTGATPQPKIRVHACEVNGQPGFSVSDNGAGFDMAHAGRLFNAFQRLHRQDEFPGIGIGLATVQRIVQRHGGQISAQGLPGHGATFSVVLPSRAGRWQEKSAA